MGWNKGILVGEKMWENSNNNNDKRIYETSDAQHNCSLPATNAIPMYGYSQGCLSTFFFLRLLKSTYNTTALFSLRAGHYSVWFITSTRVNVKIRPITSWYN